MTHLAKEVIRQIPRKRPPSVSLRGKFLKWNDASLGGFMMKSQARSPR